MRQIRRLEDDTSELPLPFGQTAPRRRLTVLAGVSIAVGLLVSLALILVGLFGGPFTTVPKRSGPSDGGQQQPDSAVTDDRSRYPTTTFPRPTIAATFAAPVPGTPEAAPPPAEPNRRPSGTDRPGNGDDRRTGKPSKSPGKPG